MNVNIKRLIVKYNSAVVGFLEELADQSIAFQYAEAWVKGGFSISPLYLPLTDKVYVSKSDHFSGLFGVFYDSLPNGWGELLVRRMLAKKGINFDKLNALTRLSLIGDDGLGALAYEPSQADKSENKYIDLDQLASDVNAIFNGLSEMANLDEVYALGGASGGARPKAHMTLDNTQWIVKFPSSMDPKNIGILEYQANETAQKAGIHVNEFTLFPSQKYNGYFAAKRFDRSAGNRLHVISLSGILETPHTIPNLDYAHLFQVVQKICVDQKDMIEAYKRMCFNVLYQNKDDHGKNMAFLYDETIGGYTLTPFYDITKTPHKFEHEMTVLGNGNPTERDLLAIAKEFKLSLKTCSSIIDDIKQLA